jgi:hypothetical protein
MLTITGLPSLRSGKLEAETVVRARVCPEDSAIERGGRAILTPECWHHKHSGTRKVLTLERLWHQKMANTRKALAPEKCWHQKGSDTRKVLIPERFWHQKIADTRGILTPKGRDWRKVVAREM